MKKQSELCSMSLRERWPKYHELRNFFFKEIGRQLHNQHIFFKDDKYQEIMNHVRRIKMMNNEDNTHILSIY